MIGESHPWRDELCRVADRLLQRSLDVDCDDEKVSFEVERDVMVSTYAIRKLLEAHKLADSTVARLFNVDAIPLIDRVPDLMNRDRLDEFYNFADQRRASLTFSDLCNQVIHSFVFMWDVADDGKAMNPEG